MNKKETIQTKTGSSIEIDPSLLIDSIDYVNELVNAHVSILENVQAMIKMYIKNGVNPDQAAEIALEFHRRAAEKARSIASGEEESSDEDDKIDSTAETEVGEHHDS